MIAERYIIAECNDLYNKLVEVSDSILLLAEPVVLLGNLLEQKIMISDTSNDDRIKPIAAVILSQELKKKFFRGLVPLAKKVADIHKEINALTWLDIYNNIDIFNNRIDDKIKTLLKIKRKLNDLKKNSGVGSKIVKEYLKFVNKWESLSVEFNEDLQQKESLPSIRGSQSILKPFERKYISVGIEWLNYYIAASNPTTYKNKGLPTPLIGFIPDGKATKIDEENYISPKDLNDLKGIEHELLNEQLLLQKDVISFLNAYKDYLSYLVVYAKRFIGLFDESELCRDLVNIFSI